MSKDIIWTKYTSSITKFFSKFPKKRGLYLQGPQGILFDDEAPDKKFNLYDGATNFLISEKDFIKIASVKGVEAIFPVTPYKVRVGIAQLFNDKEILQKINEVIDPFKGIHEKIISEYTNIAKKYNPEYVLYEDIYSLINITNKTDAAKIDGFTISSGQI